MASDIDQLKAAVGALQTQFALKFGANPANLFQQDPTLGTGPQSQLQRPYLLAYMTNFTSLPANTSTAIAFNIDAFNPTGGMHDPSGDPTNVHIPVAGVYLITSTIIVSAANIGDSATSQVYINGAAYNPVAATFPPGKVFATAQFTGFNLCLTVAVAISLQALDRVQMVVEWSPNGPGTTSSGAGNLSVTQIF